MNRLKRRLKISLLKRWKQNTLIIAFGFVLGCLNLMLLEVNQLLNISLDQMREKLDVKISIYCKGQVYQDLDAFESLMDGMNQNRNDYSIKEVNQKMILDYLIEKNETGESSGSILAISDDSYFEECGITLSRGTFFSETDYQAPSYAILAQEGTGISVGQRIEFDFYGQNIQFEVIGIYQSYKVNYDFDMTSSRFHESFMFIIPFSSALEIYKNNKESFQIGVFDDIEIVLNDSLAFQRIYEENKKLCTNINQSLSSSARMIEFCTIESNINDVETTLKPIRKMRSMISFVFTLMSVLTTAIFILTLVIILRKRKKEIAILISLGEKKSMIIFQFVFETVFLCLIGLVLASLVSQILTPILIRQMIDANLSYQKELSRIGNILKNIDYQTQKQQLLESYQNSSRFGLFLFSFGIVSILSSIPSAFLMSFFVSQHLRKLYQQEE